jgi:hypothetical protein
MRNVTSFESNILLQDTLICLLWVSYTEANENQRGLVAKNNEAGFCMTEKKRMSRTGVARKCGKDL